MAKNKRSVQEEIMRPIPDHHLPFAGARREVQRHRANDGRASARRCSTVAIRLSLVGAPTDCPAHYRRRYYFGRREYKWQRGPSRECLCVSSGKKTRHCVKKTLLFVGIVCPFSFRTLCEGRHQRIFSGSPSLFRPKAEIVSHFISVPYNFFKIPKVLKFWGGGGTSS